MNKLIMIFISILLFLVLLPIIITNINNAKIDYNQIEFTLTSTSDVITNNLSADQTLFIFENYDYITNVSDLTDDTTTQTYTDYVISDDPVIFEEIVFNGNIEYSDLPIKIHAGDTITYTRSDSKYFDDVLYIEYLQSSFYGTTASNFCMGTNQWQPWLTVNGGAFYFETGDWDSHSFTATYSNTWIDWDYVGDIGTLTFLQDWEHPLDTIHTYYSGTTTPRTEWFNPSNLSGYTVFNLTYPPSTLDLEFDTATLNLTVDTYEITSDEALIEGDQTITIYFEIPLNNNMTQLLDILPIITVLIVIVGSTTYMVVKKK